ncbi:MAG: hypothetical protein SWK76_03580 [Actinomycetota bacterium]|nr:hypothetical protein [Actinomycetota bacterium]
MRGMVRSALILTLLFGTFGCGGGATMSIAGYRENISDLHNGVASGMGYAFEKLNSLQYDDYFSVLELQDIFEQAGAVFSSAREEAKGISPPPEAEFLQADLLDFYTNGELDMDVMVNATRFFEVVVPMLVDMENLALPQVAMEADIEAVRAASAEDRETLQGYMDDLDGLRPPDDLELYQQDLLSFFQSLDESISRLDQEVTPENSSALERFNQEYPAVIAEVNVFGEEAIAYLRGLEGRLDSLIENGEELARRIGEL